ncbi:uncharacterized protein LOC144665985 [Oculina patagonica]
MQVHQQPQFQQQPQPQQQQPITQQQQPLMQSQQHQQLLQQQQQHFQVQLQQPMQTQQLQHQQPQQLQFPQQNPNQLQQQQYPHYQLPQPVQTQHQQQIQHPQQPQHQGQAEIQQPQDQQSEIAEVRTTTPVEGATSATTSSSSTTTTTAAAAANTATAPQTVATANEPVPQEATEPTAIGDTAVPDIATTGNPEPPTPTVTEFSAAFSALETLLSRQAEMQAERHERFMEVLAEYRRLMVDFREHRPSNNMPNAPHFQNARRHPEATSTPVTRRQSGLSNTPRENSFPPTERDSQPEQEQEQNQENEDSEVSTRRPHPGPTNDDDTVEDVNQEIGSPTSSADESETLASFTQRRLSELISREWNCPSCTYVNTRRIALCEMCGASRDGHRESVSSSTPVLNGLSELMDRWGGTVSAYHSFTTINIPSRNPERIIQSFMNHFRRQPQPATLQWPSVHFDDDEGVGDGVTREAFTLFWDAVVGRSFLSQGGDLAIPTLSPTYNTHFWETMGRILAYTVAVLGQFPLTRICQVVCRGLFGFGCDADEEVMVEDFLSTLDQRSRGLLSPLFHLQGERLNEFLSNSRQDVVELLREFNVPSLPPVHELRSLIVSVARYSLVECPRAPILAMHAGFQSVTGSAFQSVSEGMISAWYQQQRVPIFEELSERLQMESDEEGADRVFAVLMAFLSDHREEEGLLRNFLRYTTGSPNARGGRIRVYISAENTIVTLRTCFTAVSLPMITDDRDAEEAFTAQLLAELTDVDGWTFNSG